MSENAGPNQGRRWKKGQSGNPSGKPKGTRHKATLAAEALLDGETEALTRKAIEKALEGDSGALRLCLDRIIPPRKDRPISFDLPDMKTAADAVTGMASILVGVANSRITPAEAEVLGKLIECYAKTLEVRAFEERIEALEKRTSSHDGDKKASEKA